MTTLGSIFEFAAVFSKKGKKRPAPPKSAAAIFNFQKSKIVFYTLSTYPFLLLGNPTGDFLTETEPLGGRLGGPLVSFQQVSTRALRAQDRALRARSIKKLTFKFKRAKTSTVHLSFLPSRT